MIGDPKPDAERTLNDRLLVDENVYKIKQQAKNFFGKDMTDPIAHNLHVVDRHIRNEAVDVDSVLDLYTDDIVLEVPGRDLRLEGKAAIRANYLAMFASMTDVVLEPLDRFATPDRVVDDMRVRCRLTGPGLVNAPVPVGSRVEIRLIHHFAMRDGKICREQVFELWRAL